MRLQTLIYQGIIWRGLYYASVFLLNIVVARVLKADNSGLFNYFINNLSFLLLITGISLESALGYFASRGEIAAKKLSGIAILFALLSALLSAGLFIMYLAGTSEPWGWELYLFAALYALGVVLTNYFSALFYAAHRPVVPNAILLVVNMLGILLIIFIPDLAPDNDFLGYMLAVYILTFLLQGILIFIAWMTAERGPRGVGMPSAVEMRRMFNYAFAALLANIIFFLVYRVDYWFVKSFCTDQALGNYIQVSKLGQIFLLLPSIIATAVFTKTAGGNQEHIRSVIEIISRWLLVFYLVFVLGIFLTGKWLFPEIYGQSFNQMYLPFMLLSPGILALSTLSLLTAFYAGRNKMGINIKGSVIALVVIVVGDLLFIPRYGIGAAALVSSMGYICFQVYVLHRFRKEYRSDLLAFFIPKWSDWNKVKQFIRAEAN